MTRPEKVYLLIISLVFVLISILVYIFIGSKLWVKLFWMFILVIVPFSSLLVANEIVLDRILSDEYKNKVGFYKIKWISREFDEFAGEEIINLRNDSWNIYRLAKMESGYLYDYSFIVLPLAKAYEGFLKKILVKINLIDESELLKNPDIAISAYFNPIGNSTIFNSLRDKVRDKTIPHLIYITYQDCRNQILHYDPYGNMRLNSIEDAAFYMRRIEDAIHKAYETFKKISN